MNAAISAERGVYGAGRSCVAAPLNLSERTIFGWITSAVRSDTKNLPERANSAQSTSIGALEQVLAAGV
jgi:hypothetical protein